MRARFFGASRRTGRARRGWGLMEVAVGAVLTATLMVVVLLWVGQLARTGALGGLQRQAERDVQWLAKNISRDVAAAGPCDADGLGPTLDSVGPTELALYVDTDEDSLRDKVTWRVQDGTVTRSVQQATAPCEFAVQESTYVLADSVRTGTTTVFAPIGGGQVLPTPTSTLACATDAALCATDGTPWSAVCVVMVLAKTDGTPLAKLSDAFSWQP
jgi:hypothetical protein